MNKKHKTRGFTIVELLIVIVIIAILAVITIVAYNGIVTRANNAARAQEYSDALKLVEAYKAAYGEYPKLPAGTNYCVGTGYPSARCRDYTDAASTFSYVESNLGFTNELKKIGTPPSRHVPVRDTVGLFVIYFATGFQMAQFFDRQGSNVCPLNLETWWDDAANNRLMCGKFYQYTS